jgi:hypothetical protein
MPSFGLRGIKGWAWSPQQYLDIIPWLPTVRFNFLMNCYSSMCDIERVEWGTVGCNRWWEPLPGWKARAFEAVVRASREAGVEFCFSMNPNLFSTRFARADRAADVEALWSHYRWMQELGVRWFNVSLDDVASGVDPFGQVALVNELLRRLQVADAGAQMVFCPTIYWGDASDQAHRDYLYVIARELDPGVVVFWTGDAVVTPRISAAAGRAYREAVAHELFIWDNYPVNDDRPTMHLGPVTGRDPDLAEVAIGYMSNPMRRQDQLNRLALSTVADYAWDTAMYDPERSIERAIDELATNADQREVLRDLVAAYPGMLVFGQNQYFNPVRDRFERLRATSRAEAEPFVSAMRGLSERFDRAYPNSCAAERQTLADDVAWMRFRLGSSAGS